MWEMWVSEEWIFSPFMYRLVQWYCVARLCHRFLTCPLWVSKGREERNKVPICGRKEDNLWGCLTGLISSLLLSKKSTEASSGQSNSQTSEASSVSFSLDTNYTIMGCLFFFQVNPTSNRLCWQQNSTNEIQGIHKPGSPELLWQHRCSY